jgi:hypothetical protein
MNEIEVDYDHGLAPSSLLDAFEKRTGIRLPLSYRTVIQKHNALSPVANYFRFENRFHSELWSYRLGNDGRDCRDISFFGFGEHLPDYELIDGAQRFDVFGHNFVIAFGRSANGDYICFDYRHDPSTDEPSVVVMFHDAYEDARKMLISHVADSFDGFLGILYKSE